MTDPAKIAAHIVSRAQGAYHGHGKVYDATADEGMIDKIAECALSMPGVDGWQLAGKHLYLWGVDVPWFASVRAVAGP